VNGDGCADIVDLQATLAAQGDTNSTAGSTAVGERIFTVVSGTDTPDAAPGDGLCADASGLCTLRAAITEANQTAGADRVEFALPGSAPALIQLTSQLRLINDRSGGVTIDGYSQSGSRVNTAATGSNAIPGVEIRGNGNSAKEVAFFITSARNTIRGLLIHNVYRPVVMDGADAAENRIIGNWMGFLSGGTNASAGNFAITLNNGPTRNNIGTPDPADRNVIGNYGHAVELYGPGTDGNVIQNNVLCIGPSGFTTAECSVGVDHNFGPKATLIGGVGLNERNVIGRTRLQGIEFSHGWQPGTNSSIGGEKYQINDHRVIGNWIGFRGDGSYHADFRSGWRDPGTSDNGQAINVYDGSNDNLLDGNWVGSTFDGIQVMSSNTQRNIIRGNTIGVSPAGEPAPLSRLGVRMRLGTRFNVIERNTIRNAEIGGIGLVQDTVHNVRISRNVVTDTNGHAIDLYGVPGPDPNDPGDADTGANSLLNAPIITSATTAAVVGTALAGATVEIFRASGPAGAFGLPTEFLGDVVVSPNSTWTVPVSLASGERVTALQIDGSSATSELAVNVNVGEAPPPPPPPVALASDEYTRSLADAWGKADSGGSWTLWGAAADFDVTGTTGTMKLPAAGATRAATLSSVSERDVDLTVRASLDKVPTGGSVWVYGVARQTGSGTSLAGYRPKLRIDPNGVVYAHAGRVVDNKETSLGTPVRVPGLTATAGGFLWLRAEISGSNPTTIRVKVWGAGQTEPTDWHFTASDSTTALQGPGAVGLRAYVGGPVSNAPLVATFDELTVVDPGP